MKNLNNIGKPVPEASDPALIKPVSDALEALDTALGAKPSTLTTTAKTLVGAINEVDGDTDVLKLRPWTENTDANTLGTGIYMIGQARSTEYNYPYGYGVMVSFVTSEFVFQIFARANLPNYYVRSGMSSSSWMEWKLLTAT